MSGRFLAATEAKVREGDMEASRSHRGLIIGTLLGTYWDIIRKLLGICWESIGKLLDNICKLLGN